MLWTKLSFLGAFAKFRKSTISFVCLSVCLSEWTDIHEILYLIIFRKSVEKPEFSLKLTNITDILRSGLMYIYDNISLVSSLRVKYFRQMF